MNDAQLLQPTFNPAPVALDPAIAAKLEAGENMGIILPTEEEQAVAGAPIDLSKYPILAPDSDWDPFVADLEPQYDPNFDSLGCNIFSGTHGVNCSLNAIGVDPLYLDAGGTKTQLSARKACVDCGLDGSTGSSQSQWETGISKHGFVPALVWPFPQTISAQTFFEPIPNNISLQSLKFLARYGLTFRQVATDLDSIKAALKYGPVKIFIGTGSYWNRGEPDVIPYSSNPSNHAVLVRRIDGQGIHIYDQYPPYLKVLAPNYKIYFAFQTLLIKSKPMTIAFKEQGNPTYYVQTGNKLVPLADPQALINLGGSLQNVIELTPQQFSLFEVVNGDLFKSN